MAYKSKFADAVREAIAGRPYRKIAALVEDPDVTISPSYIADMVQGRVPKRPLVIAFGKACGLDTERLNQLLEAGELEPIAEELESYDEAYSRETRAMWSRLAADGIPLPKTASRQGGSTGLTVNDARIEIEAYERLIRELAAGKTASSSEPDPESGKGKPNGGSARRQSGGGGGRLMSGYAW